MLKLKVIPQDGLFIKNEKAHYIKRMEKHIFIPHWVCLKIKKEILSLHKVKMKGT